MADEEKLNEDELENEAVENENSEIHSTYKIPKIKDTVVKHQLSGMYQNWFLDYASYVILERAVPDIYDGLKPVQRRILHSMREKEDGRYNKVANLVGHTMQYHPHGDASIGDALVQMGQKDLLVDTQGNWGNVLTGDGAAAARYIEARLTKFALETVFNPKTTEWKLSYDGRNKEPIALPVKFPLLLAQGVEGIAVGLNSKILPHNFNELIDAGIAYLKGSDFEIYPDFQTGGLIDVSKYNDGERGGSVKVRAKISKFDNKTLVITEIPYGSNTSKVIDSIIRASDRGKIKIRKVDDNTAADVEILVHLAPGVSSDKTIDALYAFTDCEISISPNCCVIHDQKPRFMGVSEMLRISTERTKDLLQLELEIQKRELEEQFFFISLEKIFIENRIYKDKEFEESESQDLVVAHIDKRLEPFKKDFIRELTVDDILKLLEIKMKRITKFDTDKANDTLLSIQEKIAEINHHLANLVEYTIDWFKNLKTKYGKNYPRRTEIRNFENIEAAKVVEANEKLYVNYTDGFIGTNLKRDEGEFVMNCSDMDDIIVFFRDGKYKVIKIADKVFVGKNILYVSVFKKNDKRTVYNAVYRDGKAGAYYVKRFAVSSMTRDKEYDLTQGKLGSRILYFTANPNAEAEVIRVQLKPKSRLNKLELIKDFSEIMIKGRQSMGNILTKHEVHKISLKQKGGSTLGGRKVWFDEDVLRLNYDERGKYLGEFHSDDRILIVSSKGDYYTSNFDLTNHYEKDIQVIEKFDENKIWTLALYDADQKFYYLKRFRFEASQKPLNILGENQNSRLILLSDKDYPRFEILFGGSDSHRENLEIDAESFIGIKSYKAKGKRLTTFNVKKINELEPLRFAEIREEEEPDENKENNETIAETATEQTLEVGTTEESFEIIEEAKIPNQSENGENTENKSLKKQSEKKKTTEKKSDSKEKSETIKTDEEKALPSSDNDSVLPDDIIGNDDGQMSLF